MRCVHERRWRCVWLATLLVSAGSVGCTGDSQESGPSSSASPNPTVADQPDTTQAPMTGSEESPTTTTSMPEGDESGHPTSYVDRIPAATTEHPYDWTHEDVKLLDPWGDSTADSTDLIALYERHGSDRVQIRVDLLDLRDGDQPPVLIGLDYRDGGSRTLGHSSDVGSFDIDWDLLVSIIDGEASLYDPTFNNISEIVLGHVSNGSLRID